jgi:predicted CoA-substrate-specific enzyme activase
MADGAISELFSERTPVRQREYFSVKLAAFRDEYPNCRVVSCGYGKRNVETVRSVSELTALAVGLHHQSPGVSLALDVGGQDTKFIRQVDGKLKEFFVNDKCAAGSGLFFTNVLNILGLSFGGVAVASSHSPIKLSTTCAVFAQSEIVELIAEGVAPEDIVTAALRQILTQAAVLFGKVDAGVAVALSGGLTQIQDIAELAQSFIGAKVIVPRNAQYLSAIGCAIIARGFV